MKNIYVPTLRGVLLNGTLFQETNQADTLVIAITGIHGNFYSNPFYYTFGHALNAKNIDFLYAQTNDAFPQIPTFNIKTQREEVIGSWNERFDQAEDDISSYLRFAKENGYKHIILAGHSLGANKVIHYLSEHPEAEIDHFFLLSPANLEAMMAHVTDHEKDLIFNQVQRGDGCKMLPFSFMGWVECIANTAYDWVFNNPFNNVHLETDRPHEDLEKIQHTGALLIGTYDNFAGGDPVGFLQNINNHMPTKDKNDLIFIEGTGHTYQQKHQETAHAIVKEILKWRKDDEKNI